VPVALYTDHHVQRAIVDGLRKREVDVLTTVEDGTGRMPDPDLLDRATSLGRILLTYDHDLLVEAQQRQARDIAFSGVIFIRPLRLAIGSCLADLELIAKAGEPEDFAGQVVYLPL
jgi:hypothetical protein